jgi:hypothetical protein
VERATRTPIACDLSQVPVELRERLFGELRATFRRARAVRAIAGGFAIEFPSEHGTIASLGEIIEYDRRCCPFIRHALVDEPWGGPIRLELTGTQEVRDFVAAELLPLLPTEITAGVREPGA